MKTSSLRAAVSGVLAGGVALAIGELVAGVGSSQRAPVIAVGDMVIKAVPRRVKDLAISTFGTNDKLALLVGIYGVIAVLAAVLGLRAAKRFIVGAAGIATFGVVGVFAATQELDVRPVELLAPLIGAAAGIGVLRLLLGAIPEPPSAPVAVAGNVLERRSFLKLSAGAVAIGAGSVSIGRFLQARVSAAASRLAVVLPKASKPLAAIPAKADFGVDGLSPFVTPNGDFYRIDVNLLVPQVQAETWSLTVKGLVDKELTITYADVVAMPMVEADVTLACVSNEIGGRLVGNARWLGTPLLPLLERAGIDPKADQIVPRSVDGFTVGFPVDALRDGRTALLAIGMNGEPLPIAHGFPARLVVAGLYGYVSAVKWLKEIELTTFADFDPYWVKRGWAVDGPIKTMARIDTPRGFSRVQAGTVPLAGVAWAQTRGITKVEVQIDDGPWRETDLSADVGKDTWRQWLYRWDATPGSHQVTVRATDSTGETQTEERAEPFPDGATGWHSVAVIVE